VRKVKAKTSFRHRPGFTFTEVIVATTLLGLAMIPILKALTAGQVVSTIVERKSKCLILAQTQFEEIKARSIYNYSDNFAITNSAVDGSYLCTVADSVLSLDLRTVDVTVGFDGNGDSTLSDDETQITLSSLLARRY
jgi:Tfp pilus assembly protein PilV